jgi:hypothetical protein
MTAPDPIAEGRPLAGRRIALLEHRELDRLGRMLEEQGAETLRCPLVAIVDAVDPGHRSRPGSSGRSPSRSTIWC